MFAMRLKLGSDRHKEWRCCLCLHVRTATVMFGIWHLVLHVLALTVLALIMRNHHVTMQRNEDFQQNDFLPTPLSKIKDDDNPYYLPTTQDGRTIYSSDIDMGALMTVCTLSITLLMVYGTIKGRATHLLPFFCLQLFDFALTTLTATGYFCYLRSAHRLIAEHWNLPLRHELLQLSPQVLTFIVLIGFLFSMLWKAYWISVVWRCYKYLTLRHQSARNTVHYIIPEPDRHLDPDYPNMFGEHDSTFGRPVKQTPPPSYQDVMEELPPPYPAGVVSEIVHETPSRLRVEHENQAQSTSNENLNARIEADIVITSLETSEANELPVASSSSTVSVASTSEAANKEAKKNETGDKAITVNSPK